MTALGCTAMGLVLAGCAAYAASGPLSAVILRARWAWRCHGHPVPGDGEPLSCDELRTLAAILAAPRRRAARERSRT